MSGTFDPWEAKRIEDWLKDKQSMIEVFVKSDMSKELVSLVFELLQRELRADTEEPNIA